MLVGLNLRPFLAAPGPIADRIVFDTGMSRSGLATLTLLPMLLMGLGALLTPRIQVAVGANRLILTALAILMVGLLLRLASFSTHVLAGTAILCGTGVAIIQASFPGIIKEIFGSWTPTVTGLYSAMIMGGGAVGAWLSSSLVEAGVDWRVALASLAIPAAIALLVAAFMLPSLHLQRTDRSLTGLLLRRRRTWSLILAFGLVNSGYSSLITWLAPYYGTLGYGTVATANLVVVLAISQSVSALVMPALARRRADRRPWLSATVLMQVIGFIGLAVFPDLAPPRWVGLCGAGLGGSFSLVIVTALDHIPQPERAGALAAIMQGGGFIIAAFGPLAVAFLHGFGGGFFVGWMMHLLLLAVTFFLYLRFDPRHYAATMRLPQPINGPERAL